MVMTRATTRTGADLLVIGLSKENRRRLDLGQPLHLNTHTRGATAFGDPISQDLHLVIFAGDTEDSMQQELLALTGPETVVQDFSGGRR